MRKIYCVLRSSNASYGITYRDMIDEWTGRDDMGNINIEDLQPGMVLSGDVKDRSGLMILASGTEIADKHIKIFKSWGITEADVGGIEQDDLTTAVTARIDPALRQAAEIEADHLFRHNQRNHPVVDRLYHLFILRHARRHSGNDEHVS